MARSAGQRPPGRRSGVALGVLGIMLLAFFAIVFMLGRPGYWKSFNDLVHHPFDPHPIGIDKRHKETTITQTQTGATTGQGISTPSSGQIQSTSSAGETGASVQQASPSPPPATPSPSPSPPPASPVPQPAKDATAATTTTVAGTSTAGAQSGQAATQTQAEGSQTATTTADKPAGVIGPDPAKDPPVNPAAATTTTPTTTGAATTNAATGAATTTAAGATTTTTTPTTTTAGATTTTPTTTTPTTTTAGATTTTPTTTTAGATTTTTTPTTTTAGATTTPTTTTTTPTTTAATTGATTTTPTTTATTGAATTTPTTTTPTATTTAATDAAATATTPGDSSSSGGGGAGADTVAAGGSKEGEEAEDEEDDGQLTTLDNEYKPTREMVQRIAQNGYLMVTWANYHYFDFVRTWVSHVQSVGVTGYIVGAMDDHLLREMIALKYNCFSMKSGLTLGDFGWGSSTFAKMGREKIRLISIFLKLDVSVVIADVDVLWLRNPLPYFDRFPEADILTSSDSTFATVTDDGLEKWPEAGAAANIGIMLFRKKSLDFVEKWIEIIEADDKIWDQNAFNDLFRKGWKNLDQPNKNLFLGYDGTLTMGILPVSLFASGHTMFVQRLGQTLGMEPYAVHATFQFSGTPGKRHRMREFRIYNDPPEYYDHTVGFISFDMDGLTELLKDAGPATNKMDLANVQGHFKLVNHQLLRLRTAFAISSMLHRALVVPPLWCGLDRWWAPHPGRIPGATFKLPFQCPLDHVIDLENGVFKDLPEDHFGPRTEIREHSFFNNTLMTPRVRDDRVVVEICAAGAAECSDGREPAKLQIDGGTPKIRVQGGLPSGLLEVALSGVKGTKVLHFTTMANAMGGFSDPAAATRFANRMRLYGSIWCCVMAHPGHIHYDLLWDVVPHTDKFQREWNSTWLPVTGP